MQTVRGWRTLLLLGTACALFVGVVVTVVTLPAEPPVAAQVPARPAVEPPRGA